MRTPLLDALDTAQALARLRRQLPPPATRRHLRVDAGLPLRVLAEVLEVSVPCIARWENGQRQPRDPKRLAQYGALLRRLARAGLDEGDEGPDGGSPAA